VALPPDTARSGAIALPAALSFACNGIGRASAALLLALLSLATALPPAGAAEGGPTWAELQPEHQKILAPLKDDWPNIEADRKLKWVDIARRYPTMSPEKQQRLQERMKSWAELSAEERAEVRKRYKMLRDMPPEQRREIQRKWREYDSLSEEEKASLRQAHPAPPIKPKPPN
jgi:hypothetical protein